MKKYTLFLIFSILYQYLVGQTFSVMVEVDPIVVPTLPSIAIKSSTKTNFEFERSKFVSQQVGISFRRTNEHLVLSGGIYSFSDNQSYRFNVSTGISNDFGFLETEKSLDLYRHRLGLGFLIGHNTGKWEFSWRYGFFSTVFENQLQPTLDIGKGRITNDPNNPTSVSLHTKEKYYSNGFWPSTSRLTQFAIGHHLSNKWFVALAYTINRWAPIYYSLDISEIQVINGITMKDSNLSIHISEATDFLSLKVAHTILQKEKIIKTESISN